MKVDFNFKHVDHSQALVEYATERMEKLTRFELKPMDVHFTVSMEGRHECTIEANVLEGRRKFKAEATSDDFYRSVEMVVNKLSRQLSKNKARVKHHKNVENTAYGKISRLHGQDWPEQAQAESDELMEPLRKTG